MNREERRAFERKIRQASKSKAKADGDAVLLKGGPMDGWYVRLDAPALTQDWGATHGGSYKRADKADRYGVQLATWQPDERAEADESSGK